jgi:hypothetical protein
MVCVMLISPPDFNGIPEQVFSFPLSFVKEDGSNVLATMITSPGDLKKNKGDERRFSFPELDSDDNAFLEWYVTSINNYRRGLTHIQHGHVTTLDDIRNDICRKQIHLDTGAT